MRNQQDPAKTPKDVGGQNFSEPDVHLQTPSEFAIAVGKAKSTRQHQQNFIHNGMNKMKGTKADKGREWGSFSMKSTST